MMLGDYVRMSTANPTGWRPWQSRLSHMGFYIPNTYPLPTTGRGPYLLQPGVSARPAASGGLGDAASDAVTGLNTINLFGVNVDTTLLLAGVGVLFVAVYLFGSGQPKRKARRLRKRISRSQSKLRALQAG